MPLNARDNRIEKELAKAKAAEPAPLNPAFPYVRKAFDPFLFGVQKPPPKPVAATLAAS